MNKFLLPSTSAPTSHFVRYNSELIQFLLEISEQKFGRWRSWLEFHSLSPYQGLQPAQNSEFFVL